MAAPRFSFLFFYHSIVALVLNLGPERPRPSQSMNLSMPWDGPCSAFQIEFCNSTENLDVWVALKHLRLPGSTPLVWEFDRNQSKGLYHFNCYNYWWFNQLVCNTLLFIKHYKNWPWTETCSDLFTGDFLRVILFLCLLPPFCGVFVEGINPALLLTSLCLTLEPRGQGREGE